MYRQISCDCFHCVYVVPFSWLAVCLCLMTVFTDCLLLNDNLVSKYQNLESNEIHTLHVYPLGPLLT